MIGKLYPTAIIVVVIILIAAAHQTAFAQSNDRLATIMQETDLKFKVLNQYSYLTPFQTDTHDRINVYVTYKSEDKEFVLIYTTLLDYEDGHEFRPELLHRALRINNDYPGVKLSLDPERGDIDGQTELYVPTLNAESLSLHIHMIAAMADRFMPALSEMEEEGD